MNESESPLRRSIGVAGVIRWLLVVAGIVAIGAAFSAGRAALGIAGAVFLVVAAALALRARRARQDAAASVSEAGP